MYLFQDGDGILVVLLHDPVLKIGNECGTRVLNCEFLCFRVRSCPDQIIDVIGTNNAVEIVFIKGMGSQLLILLEKLRKLFGILCTPDDFNIGWPFSTQRSFSEVVKFLLVNHISSICLVLPEIRHVPSVGVGRSSCWLRSEEHTSELQSRGHLVCR